MRILISWIILLVFNACNKVSTKVIDMPMTPGERIITDCIRAHGGTLYDKAHYSFVFRDKQYEFNNNGSEYSYQVRVLKDGVTRTDVLDNSGFSRTENGKVLSLTEKQKSGYGNALNSVIYFATLPHKLQDKAVHKKYGGSNTIEGKQYEVVEVTFSEEGGGTDHDDTFHYWINKETNLIDFLAYDYHVNGGGVRFRTAYNTRRVGGIIFQDYVNYKAVVGTALADLPDLWVAGKLKELSRIETEDVQKL